MKNVVVRNFDRPSPAEVDALAEFGVATVHEAIGRRGLMASRLRPIYPHAQAVGTAFTISVAPGDNTMLHVAVELAQEGDFLVVSPTSPCEDGYFGDLFGTALKARGVRGLVIDAGCRDIRTLEEMGFPVWSRAVFAQGTVKETLGTINLPLVCAGQLVTPGDVIVADDDGVLVVPRREVGDAAKAARERADKERSNRQRFLAGEVGLDVYGMRERLMQKGLVYVDHLSEIDTGER